MFGPRWVIHVHENSLRSLFSSREHHSCSSGTLGTLTYWWGCSHKIISSFCCLVDNLFPLPFSHADDAKPLRMSSQQRWNTSLAQMTLDLQTFRGCCGDAVLAGRESACCHLSVTCAFEVLNKCKRAASLGNGMAADQLKLNIHHLIRGGSVRRLSK